MQIIRIQLHQRGTSEIATLQDSQGRLSFELVKNLDKGLVDQYYQRGGELVLPEH